MTKFSVPHQPGPESLESVRGHNTGGYAPDFARWHHGSAEEESSEEGSPRHGPVEINKGVSNARGDTHL
jgi:hypothetical protein